MNNLCYAMCLLKSLMLAEQCFDFFFFNSPILFSILTLQILDQLSQKS